MLNQLNFPFVYEFCVIFSTTVPLSIETSKNVFWPTVVEISSPLLEG